MFYSNHKNRVTSLFRKLFIYGVKLLLLAITITALVSIGDAKELKSKQHKKSDDDIVEINIESTRPKLTAGRGFGLSADIRNLTKSTIYLNERYITMTLPPELMQDPNSNTLWAIFPTEYHTGIGDNYYRESIEIAPGESYKVLWQTYQSVTSQATTTLSFCNVIHNFKSNIISISNDINSEMRFLFFSPGDYSVTVSAKYWLSPTKPLVNSNYHTKIESKTLTVESPQSVILFGALVGGLISYFLLPQARRKLISIDPDKRMQSKFELGPGVIRCSKEIAGILGAALLSIIATILLARLSETQFLIRVTVADFWGAVAIGFVANYAGAEVLNKIIKLPPKDKINGSSIKNTK